MQPIEGKISLMSVFHSCYRMVPLPWNLFCKGYATLLHTTGNGHTQQLNDILATANIEAQFRWQ